MVSVIYVNYYTEEILRSSLLSLKETGEALNPEVIVVDNGSEQNPEEVIRPIFPTGKVLRPSHNLGYGAGINFGAQAATRPYILAVNPDVIFLEGALERLVGFLEGHPRAAVATPLLLTPDLRPWPPARRFPSFRYTFFTREGILTRLFPNNPLSREYLYLDHLTHLNGPFPVEVALGTCMLIRKDVFDRMGGFDPGYFLFLEDVDFCWRLRQAGYEAWVVPDARAIHVFGYTRRRVPFQTYFHYRRSALHYLRKYRGPLSVAAGFLGSALQLAVEAFRNLLNAGSADRAWRV